MREYQEYNRDTSKTQPWYSPYCRLEGLQLSLIEGRVYPCGPIGRCGEEKIAVKWTTLHGVNRSGVGGVAHQDWARLHPTTWRALAHCGARNHEKYKSDPDSTGYTVSNMNTIFSKMVSCPKRRYQNCAIMSIRQHAYPWNGKDVRACKSS